VIHVADTHALVWFLEGDRRLSRRAREALSDTRVDIVIPTIVLAEVADLYNKDRIDVNVDEVLASVARAARSTIYPLDLPVVQHFPSGLGIHDAIIVATALTLRDTLHESVAAVTKDAEITASGLVEVIW